MAKAEASVQELVDMIQRGELRLPEMQRRYVWRAPRVRDLFDSLYRGYPSGAILVWETDEEVPLQDFSVSQAANPYGSTRLLLDGQQRLTSLSAVTRGEPIMVKGRKKPIELLFNLEHPDELGVVTEVDEDGDDESGLDDEADSTEDELQNRFDQMTFVVGTRKLASLPHWVNVSEVFTTDTDAPFLKRAGVSSFEDSRYDKYTQRLARLRGIRNYSYRMDVLERSLSYDEVTEIFVRVNSLGAKLRSSDLALAQITAKWRGALATFQEFQARCDKDGFALDLAIHLKNLVVFATGQSRFKTVGSIPLETLQTSWEESCKATDFAISFLKNNLGIDSPALLSSPFLIVTTGYFAKQQNYEITPEEASRFKYWALTANAKGRYSRGSSETLLDQDLAVLRNGGGADGLIDRLRQQVGRLDVSATELIGRNQRSALFKTMFLAFRKAGATDWNSNLQISLNHKGAQDKLQFHHIFPKAVLTSAGRVTRDINDIANLAFIGGKTNRKISSKSPVEYLNELRDKVGDDVFLSQCIPLDEDLLGVDAYDAFLTRRRELIADRLNAFLGSDTTGSPGPPSDPHLAALDGRLEATELRLRTLIEATLKGGGEELPSHISDKAQRRIADAAKKNPASINPNTATHGERLAYCDLRELQDIVTAKNLWSAFEPVFGSKEVLNIRFAQAAELRNAIRHSRPAGDVLRKDGEAALTWFEGVLQPHE